MGAPRFQAPSKQVMETIRSVLIIGLVVFFVPSLGTGEVQFDYTLIASHTGTPVPGIDDFSRIIGSPLVSGSQVAFYAAVGDPLVTHEGHYIRDISGVGSLTVIADWLTPIPDGTGTFTSLRHVSFEAGGAAFRGEGEAGQIGIYKYRNGVLSTVADLTTDVPGQSAGTTFTDFYLDAWFCESDMTAFGAYFPDGEGVYVEIDGALRLVADTNTEVPPGGMGNFVRFVGAPAVDAGRVAFRGESDVSSEGIYLWDNGVLAMVADTTTPVPGGFGTFTSFHTWRPVNIDGPFVVFRGEWNNEAGDEEAGIYSYQGGVLSVLADFSTVISNTGERLTFIGTQGIALDGSEVAFLGQGTTDVEQGAIYATIDDSLIEVASDGFVAFQITAGVYPQSRDGNVVAFQGGVAGGGRGGGVWVATIILCGDGLVNPETEECDDGNNDDGDGCSACCQLEQVQEKDQQKCIVELNKGFAKVAKAQGKDICQCIKDGAKGKLGTSPTAIEDCLTSDPKMKVAKAKQKAIEKGAQKCTVPPDFGATDPNTANRVAVEKELKLIHSIFGPDLDAVIIPAAGNPAASKCQVDAAKAAKKCQDTKLKEFIKCKKSGLKNKSGPPSVTLPMDTPGDLAECMGFDPKGKIDKACGTQLDDKIDKSCAGLDYATLFPGDCSGEATLSDFERCVDSLVECQVCLALNEADGLNRDCDLFDDGLANGSCGACGDGEVNQPSEECDDGNNDDGDGCSSDCLDECGDGLCSGTENPANCPLDCACSGGAQLLSFSPSGTEALCDDPSDSVCEQDLESICPSGWGLCTPLQHNNRNTGWTFLKPNVAVGEIFCRTSLGAGHYTLGGSALDIPLPLNCSLGSSRPSCPASFGCNELFVHALCCAPTLTCGDGVVDPPEEECDDGDLDETDDCLNSCSFRTPADQGVMGCL